MSDFDDMNATPLGKLPMPVVQSKNDASRMDPASAGSYSEILKTMTADRPASMPTMPMNTSPHDAKSTMAMGGSLQGLLRPPVAAPAVAEPTEYMQDEAPWRHAYNDYPPRRKRVAVKRAKPTPDAPPQTHAARALELMKTYRTSILVGLVVFLVLKYVAPKLATALPGQVLTANGKFNARGLLLLAAMAGGIHRVADRYAPVLE